MAPREHTTVLLTRRELAALLHVHPMTVTKWERAGLPIAVRGRRGKPSRYRELEVRAWLQQRELEANEDGASLVHARARKELAQAIEAEQRVALRARQLIPIDDVDRIWSAEVAAVRARLLSWPLTLSERLYRTGAVEGAAGIERVLQEVVDHTLRELSASRRTPRKKAPRKKAPRRPRVPA